MKIRKKAREQTAFEKRDTSIILFSLVALVPLLFTFFLGFSLGRAEDANQKNLVAKLEQRLQDIDSLTKSKLALEQEIADLAFVFKKTDTLLLNFEDKTTQKLQDELNKLSDPNDESAFYSWDIDRKKVLKDFEYSVTSVNGPNDFSNQPNLKNMLEIGQGWLNDYSSIKGLELYERMLKKKLLLGTDVTKEMEDKIEELNKEVNEKTTELLICKNNLLSKGGESSTAQQDLMALEIKNEQIKTNLQDLVADIQTNILPELQAKGWFPNKDEVNVLKDRLNAKLDNIKTKAGELSQ